ncbi:hypothetical protein QBC46DRAFT_412656 [Diplogelasinospora grovesii]|uniref:Uncharacterized protein n=1 Tax=Diplogelasinospora grovesii TaxID=303347 RepID=A0AAN6MZH8_9PEZI|nr:hypothetical protein QBC46DRAFT_412656 [Diplogelasinospora grovesii]
MDSSRAHPNYSFPLRPSDPNRTYRGLSLAVNSKHPIHPEEPELEGAQHSGLAAKEWLPKPNFPEPLELPVPDIFGQPVELDGTPVKRYEPYRPQQVFEPEGPQNVVELEGDAPTEVPNWQATSRQHKNAPRRRRTNIPPTDPGMVSSLWEQVSACRENPQANRKRHGKRYEPAPSTTVRSRVASEYEPRVQPEPAPLTDPHTYFSSAPMPSLDRYRELSRARFTSAWVTDKAVKEFLEHVTYCKSTSDFVNLVERSLIRSWPPPLFLEYPKRGDPIVWQAERVLSVKIPFFYPELFSKSSGDHAPATEKPPHSGRWYSPPGVSPKYRKLDYCPAASFWLRLDAQGVDYDYDAACHKLRHIASNSTYCLYDGGICSYLTVEFVKGPGKLEVRMQEALDRLALQGAAALYNRFLLREAAVRQRHDTVTQEHINIPGDIKHYGLAAGQGANGGFWLYEFTLTKKRKPVGSNHRRALNMQIQAAIAKANAEGSPRGEPVCLGVAIRELMELDLNKYGKMPSVPVIRKDVTSNLNDDKEPTVSSLTETSVWNGCEARLLQKFGGQQEEDINALGRWINEIHRWAIGRYAMGVENDLRVLADASSTTPAGRMVHGPAAGPAVRCGDLI